MSTALRSPLPFLAYIAFRCPSLDSLLSDRIQRASNDVECRVDQYLELLDLLSEPVKFLQCRHGCHLVDVQLSQFVDDGMLLF